MGACLRSSKEHLVWSSLWFSYMKLTLWPAKCKSSFSIPESVIKKVLRFQLLNLWMELLVYGLTTQIKYFWQYLHVYGIQICYSYYTKAKMEGKWREFEILSTLHKRRGLTVLLYNVFQGSFTSLICLATACWWEGHLVSWLHDSRFGSGVWLYSLLHRRFLVRSRNAAAQCCVTTLKTAV